MLTGKEPQGVFTPRSAVVNDVMYIPRGDLESALLDALAGSQHIIIHGESGSGKSWLYKRVFTEEEVQTDVVNMANALLSGDLNAAFRAHVSRQGQAIRKGYKESKSAKFMGSGLDHTDTYEIEEKQPFEVCLERLRSKAGSRRACLVFDNFESIVENTEVLNQIGACITLLDDEIFAGYDVKILIVGTPSNIRDYFAKSANLSTVANRLHEIAEVARLSRQEASELLLRGLVSELGCELEDEESVLRHACWVTHRIPQQVQEYGLALALEALDSSGIIDDLTVEKADRRFLRGSLSASYSRIVGAMNSRETKTARRNQAIFALGQFDGDDFDSSDIELIVGRLFPATTGDVNLNLSKSLTELASLENALIRRTPNGTHYRFSAPKIRMCIRSMLRRNAETNKVERIDLSLIK